MCVLCKLDIVLTFLEVGEYAFNAVVSQNDDKDGFRLNFGRVVVVWGTIVLDV